MADGATRDEALGGGEDYELLVATGAPDALVGAFRAAGLGPRCPSGWCTDSPGQHTLDGDPLPPAGLAATGSKQTHRSIRHHGGMPRDRPTGTETDGRRVVAR